MRTCIERVSISIYTLSLLMLLLLVGFLFGCLFTVVIMNQHEIVFAYMSEPVNDIEIINKMTSEIFASRMCAFVSMTLRIHDGLGYINWYA